MCNVFHGENFEALISLVMHLCGIQYSDNCVFRKGVTFFYSMTPIPI